MQPPVGPAHTVMRDITDEADVLDMFNKEDEEEIQEKDNCTTICCNRGIIRNTSKARVYWDIFIILFVLYNTFSVPFDAAFGDEEDPVVSLDWMNTMIDMFFCMDVLISFRTSFVDGEGEEVLNGKIIALNYVKSGRFFLDFIASVPLD